jgi:hypothetical protein
MTRWPRISRSAASSALAGCRRLSTAGLATSSRSVVRAVCLPIRHDGVELIEVSERTRDGYRIASAWAIIPPSDRPTTWAGSQPSASSTAPPSPAMSSRR